MPFFYYPDGGDTYQIEADRYEISGFNTENSQAGWFQNLVWDSGLSETVFGQDTDPNTIYQVTGDRCGGGGQGLSYTKNSIIQCAQNGSSPRRRLTSISFFYSPGIL